MSGLLAPVTIENFDSVNSTRPSSDFSSIGPSQSASQVNGGSSELHMPAPISLMNSGLFGDPPSTMVRSPVSEQDAAMRVQQDEESTHRLHQDDHDALLPPHRPQSAFSGATGTSSMQHYSPILVATPMTALKLESAQAVAVRVPPRDSPGLGESSRATPPTSSELFNPTMRLPPPHALKENGYAYEIPTAESSPRAGPSNLSTPGRSSSRASSQRSTSDRHGSSTSDHGRGRLGLGTWHRPQIERRITEEEIRKSLSAEDGPIAATVSKGDGSSDEIDDDILLRKQKELVKEGKLAVVENPRFMSETRRRELEREQEEQERRRLKEEERSRINEMEKGEKRKKFTLFHSSAHHGRSASVSVVSTVTPGTLPAKVDDTGSSPSPNKSGFLGSLKGLFTNRTPSSPATPVKKELPTSSGRPEVTTSKEERTPTAADDSDSESEAGPSSTSRAHGPVHNFFLGSSSGSKKDKEKPVTSGKWETRTNKNIQKLAKRESFDDSTMGASRKSKPSLYGGGIAASVVAGVGLNTSGLNLPGASGSAVRAAAAGLGRGRAASDVGLPSSETSTAIPTAPGRKLTKKNRDKDSGATPSFAPAPNPLASVRAPPVTSLATATASTPPQATATRKVKHRRSASVDVDAQRRNSVYSNKTTDEEDVFDGDHEGTASSGGEGMIVDLGRRRRRAASETGTGTKLQGADEVRAGVARRQAVAPDAAAGKLTTTTSQKTRMHASDTEAMGSSGPATVRKKSLMKKKVDQSPSSSPVHVTADRNTPIQTPSRKPSLKGPSTSASTSPASASKTPPLHTMTAHGGATVLTAGGEHPSGTLISQPGWKSQAQATGGGLSRNNSMLSTASAPPTPGTLAAGGRGKAKRGTVLGQGMSGASTGGNGGAAGVARRGSLNVGSASTSGTGTRDAGADGSVVQATPAIPSLMSIVEDVAKLNKEGWRRDLDKDKDRITHPITKSTVTVTTTKSKIGTSSGIIEIPKAPPPVSREMLEGELNHLVGVNQSRSSLATITPTSSPPVGMARKTGPASPPSSTTKAEGNVNVVPSTSTAMFEIKAPGSVFSNQQPSSLSPPSTQKPSIMRSSSSPSQAAVTNANTVFNTNPNNLTVVSSSNNIGPSHSTSRPDKSPLRSALKGTSRTPSPAIYAHTPSTQLPTPPVNGSLPWAYEGSSFGAQPSRKVGKGKGKAKADLPPPVVDSQTDTTSDDESYETGNEFYSEDDGDDDEKRQPTAIIASKVEIRAVPKVAVNGHALPMGGEKYDNRKAVSQSELSQSSVSTITVKSPPAPSSAASSTVNTSTISTVEQQTQQLGQGQVARRRKSVRVSLQPTFSPSPPAIEYDHEEEQSIYAPWSRQDTVDHAGATRDRDQSKLYNGSGSHAGSGRSEPLPAPIPLRAAGTEPKTVVDVDHMERDMWQDSGSDEDEEYANAKRLLTRAAKKERTVSRLAMVANRA